MMTDKTLREIAETSKVEEELLPLTREELRQLHAQFQVRMAGEIEIDEERERLVGARERRRKIRRDRDADCLAAAAESSQIQLATALHGVGNESWELVPVFADYNDVIRKLEKRRRYLEVLGADASRCEAYLIHDVESLERWGR